MPEGDTIHKVAAFMHPLLQGQRLHTVIMGRAMVPELTERCISGVDAVGKHLLVHLSGWVLRVHLGMHGSWHSYGTDERWQRPRWQASVELHTETQVFVCFNAQDVEAFRPDEVRQSPVARLGPDLLADDCDFAEIIKRARRLPEKTPLVDILLTQSLSCGIGNVYKNDLLFMYRLHPLTPQDALSDTQLEEIFQTARRLLLSNLGGWRRTTTYDRREKDLGPNVPRLFVYGHVRCQVCNSAIIKKILGKQRRQTFWCPTCQPVRAT